MFANLFSIHLWNSVCGWMCVIYPQIVGLANPQVSLLVNKAGWRCQKLNHACLWINTYMAKLRMVHETIRVFLLTATWVTAVSLEHRHASKPGFAKEVVILRYRIYPRSTWSCGGSWLLDEPWGLANNSTFKISDSSVSNCRVLAYCGNDAEREIREWYV